MPKWIFTWLVNLTTISRIELTNFNQEKKVKTKATASPELTENLSTQQQGGSGNGCEQAHSREQMVAQAAYYLSEQRGFSPGNEIGDWLTAEMQFDQIESQKKQS